MPSGYKAENGYRLGQWVGAQRYKRDKLTAEQESRLASLDGWVWAVSNSSVRISREDWEEIFSYLCQYVKEYGNAKVPDKFKIESGFDLGSWVSRQRSNQSELMPEQKLKLESLEGWVWNVSEAAWEESFMCLLKYAEEKGDARVPAEYKTTDGYSLGGWVRIQRVNRNKLDSDKILRLESVAGWIWGVREEQWEVGFAHLIEFVEQEGHAYVTDRHRSPDGYGLGNWVKAQRKKRDNLKQWQVSKLESVKSWLWSIKEASWEEGFSYLTKYVALEGHAKVLQSYKTEDGFRLGAWVGRLRSNRNILSAEQLSRLESLNGWVWDVNHAAWEESFLYLTKYVETEGHAQVPSSYKTEDGYALGNWVGKQRSKRAMLTTDQKSRLDALGFYWNFSPLQ